MESVQVVSLTEVFAEVEEHLNISILEVFPVAVTNRLLLSTRPIDAPEKRAIPRRFLTGEEGSQVRAVKRLSISWFHRMTQGTRMPPSQRVLFL
jgi:hypothetical protein